MKAPVFRELAVGLLRSSPYNPPGRTKKVKDLVDSMSRDGVGLIYPILVSRDGVVIDGHRRVAAAKRLGWKTIAAFVTEMDADTIYANVNGAVRKMGGNDALVVWLKNKQAVVPSLGGRLQLMVDALGEARVRKMARAGYSLKLFILGYKVASYCGRPSDIEFIAAAVDWLMATRFAAMIGRVVIGRLASPKAVAKAVAAGRPLFAHPVA